MTRRDVSEAAVERAAAASTKASAKLEGRVVEPGHVRSAKTAWYVASRVEKSS